MQVMCATAVFLALINFTNPFEAGLAYRDESR